MQRVGIRSRQQRRWAGGHKRLLNEVAALPLGEALVHERETARAANSRVTREEIDVRLARLRRQPR